MSKSSASIGDSAVGRSQGGGIFNDPDLLKRSEKIFNAKSPAQKMKIFSEMEEMVKHASGAKDKGNYLNTSIEKVD